jgi:SAM-dependent methyltransferase
MRENRELEVAEYWNANAPVWIDQVEKGYDLYWEELNNPAIFEFIGDARGKSVLDAGCGEGRNTRLLAKRGADVCDGSTYYLSLTPLSSFCPHYQPCN